MKKIFIFIILLITVLTRFWRLDLVPVSLSNDEISIAYDAYSVGHTLHDEHNNFLPLSFQSHNTYKAPLTIYLTVPSVLVFGNTEFAARFPSALLGCLTVLFLGLLVFELSKNLNLALISSFILSITPWHIYTSRMILESNLALFFVIAGIYLFFYGLHRQQKFTLILSFISFALSIYSYHTEWGLTPLIILSLLFLNLKTVIKKPIFYFVFILFLVLITPIFLDFLKNINTHARANTEILFKDPYIAAQLQNSPNIFKKFGIITNSIIGSYASYLNLSPLFFNGLGLLPQKDPYQTGLFLAPLLPLFLIGLFNLKKYFKNNYRFLYLWFFLSPLVPSLTQGGPNFVRNLVSVAPYTLAIGVGVLFTFEYLKNKKILTFLSILILFVSFIYFAFEYYFLFPKFSGENFQYGYKTAAEFIKSNYSNYQKIIVDPHFGDHGIYDGVPHLYLSYFTYLDPRQMLKRQSLNGLYYDKYEIRSINWNTETIKPQSLYLIPESNLPDNSKNLQTKLEIKLPDGKPEFQIFSSY